MAHFLPINYDGVVGRLVGDSAPADVRPVKLSALLLDTLVLR